jgi:iron complex outermembrane recepter protein
MSKYVFAILFIICSTQAVQAYTNECDLKLSGIVKSSDTREPIPMATLELIQRKKSIVADINGQFVFENICSGQFEVLVKLVGYKEYRSTIVLGEDNLDIELMLDPAVTDLGSVAVEGTQPNVIATLNTSEVSQNDLERSKGESLGQTLTNITGVNVLQTGPTIAKPVIHGLHSNRVLILNNGIRQEGQQWGQEHAPEIDPFVATNLSLIKGAAAVKYGSDAIGGVILVNSPDLPNKAGIGGQLNVLGASNNRMYASSGYLEGGIKRLDGFGWRIQGTYKKGGDAKTPDYILTNTGIEEKNYSGAIGYHNDKFGAELYYSNFDAEIAILSASHNSSTSDLEDAIGASEPSIILPFSYDINKPKQVLNHQLTKAFIHTDLRKIGELKLLYGYQQNLREEYDIRKSDLADKPSLSLSLITHTIDLDLDLVPMGNWKSDVGISYINQVNENGTDLGVSPLIPNYDNYTIGGYFITRYVQNKFELELGVRHDIQQYQIRKFDENDEIIRPEFDYANTTGSVGFIFYLGNQTKFRSNIGTAWRAPNVNELFSDGLHHGAAAIEEGNPNLKSESSIKWISNFEHNSEKINLNTSIYYNVISNYIYLRPENVSLTTRGAFPVFRYAQTDASFFGFDIDVIVPLNQKINWVNKISYLNAIDQNNDGPLINIPANRIRTGLDYNFTDTNRITDGFISFSALMVNKQYNAPRVITLEQIQIANDHDFDLFKDNPSAFDILDAPSAYMTIDASAGFNLPFKNNSSSLGIIITASNLLDVSYRDYMNRFRYYADEVGRNVSLKLNFVF